MNKMTFFLLYVIVIGSACGGYLLVEFYKETLNHTLLFTALLSLAFLSISLQITVLMRTRTPITKWKWLSLSSGLLIGGLTFLYLFLLK
ncbi:hypothetical protein [Rossellomorea arthrocnemi]|jgi:hypothetical protein|uniref:hypothetical protein n=1 Tax=Rossellomorea arthrocnemi TaxID=2769542 RepID=UPI00191A9C2A|nr:hypothetical protein [Rossellomorea arthrocnemi]